MEVTKSSSDEDLDLNIISLSAVWNNNTKMGEKVQISDI